MVDEKDFDKLNQFSWYCSSTGYAVRNGRNSEGKRKTIWMHREIVDTPNGMDTDHINRNRLDNRRNNLRIATRSENQWNSNIRRDNKSGLKGVSFKKQSKRWVAQISSFGKVFHIGYFNTPKEASKAYNQRSQGLFNNLAIKQ